MKKPPRLLNRLIFITILTLFSANLAALKWGTYTNTNNVTDIVVTLDHKIYAATWGGVVQYEQIPNEKAAAPFANYIKTLTSVDGLVSNDIRTLAYEAGTGDVWAGSFNDGITIIKINGLQTLNTTAGLPSNKVRRIVTHQSYIYVATDLGISQFYYLPGVYFPLLLHQYNVTNTQGGLASNDIRDIVISDAGYLYCATPEGISFVHSDSLDIDSAWHSWSTENSPLPNAPVLSLSINADYLALNTMTTIHRRAADPFATDWQTWHYGSGSFTDSVSTVCLTPSNGILLAYGAWDEDTMNLLYKDGYPFGFINSAGTLLPHGVLPPELDSLWTYPTASIYRFVNTSMGLMFATWSDGIYLYNGDWAHQVNNCIGFQTISEIVTDNTHNIWLGSGWLGGNMTKKGTRGVSKWSGNLWTTYTYKNSPLPVDNIKNVAVDANNNKWFGSWEAASTNPYGWKPGAIMFDDTNDIWKWYTRFGIRTWDADTGWSDPVFGPLNIFNNTISEIATDLSGNILISSHGGGVVVFDQDYEPVGSFLMPSSASLYQSASLIYDSGSRYFFGLFTDDRLVIWDNPSLPIGNSEHWNLDMPPDLSDGLVYGVVSLVNVFGETENWVAASSGLFMWDGTDWFWYYTDIKRRKFVNGDWVNDTLYYYDEERLFGSVRTTPTTIFKDPFERIWIGSLENGFTMYDPETERFTNYFMDNSPLLSNYITCFGYDPIRGLLLIGTPDGLNTLEIGISIKTETALHKVKAFPNPFFPDKNSAVRIVNLPSLSMPKGTNVCKIYDSSGQFVIELKENYFARFDWNGLNRSNKKCSSGIYYFVVSSSSGETKRGKIALIR